MQSAWKYSTSNSFAPISFLMCRNNQLPEGHPINLCQFMTRIKYHLWIRSHTVLVDSLVKGLARYKDSGVVKTVSMENSTNMLCHQSQINEQPQCVTTDWTAVGFLLHSYRLAVSCWLLKIRWAKKSHMMFYNSTAKQRNNAWKCK